MKKLFLGLILLSLPVIYSAFVRMGAVPTPETLAHSAQFNPQTLRFENALATPRSFVRPRAEVMYDFFFKNQDAKPPEPLPEVQPDLNALAEKSQGVRFIWFGHSSILLEIDGLRLLIDPMFSDHAFLLPMMIKRFQAPVLSLEQIPNIDAVLISHDHYDHLDYLSIQALKNRGIDFFVPLGVDAHLLSWGISADKIHSLDWWQQVDFKGLQLNYTPSQHFSGRSFGRRNQTLWGSWAIVGQNQRVFFSGDSGYSPHYREIGERLGPFELTFLENGAYNEDWYAMHQFPEQAVQAHMDLRGQYMVPIHWGMFDLALHPWYEPILRLEKAAKAADIQLLNPKLGQLTTLTPAPAFDDWWSVFPRH